VREHHTCMDIYVPGYFSAEIYIYSNSCLSPAHEVAPVVSIDDWLQKILLHGSGETTRSPLEVAEEQVIRAVVSQVNGNQSQAARILGIDPKKVGRRMAKYGIGGA